jgi:uncharacterized HAD superfamily protein
MIYYVDIDGTICDQEIGRPYNLSNPFTDRILHFNDLFDKGNEIHYYTARGSESGVDYTELTTQQLKEWNVKYTSLSLGKPHYDIWIDDKAQNVDQYFEDEYIKDQKIVDTVVNL